MQPAIRQRHMREPGLYGCGNKVSFQEVSNLSLLISDGAMVDSHTIGETTYVQSIDRVSDCSREPDLFAQMAIRHCINDVYAAGAEPFFVSICFEFNSSSTPADRAALSAAFFRAAHAKGLDVGKCHSVMHDDATSVVLSTMGKKISDCGTSASVCGRGKLLLTKRIGYSKLLFMKEREGTSVAGMYPFMGGRLDPVPHPSIVRAMTDVSGFGLAGAAIALAQRTTTDLNLELDSTVMASADVLGAPEPCMQNWIGDYSSERTVIDESSWPIAGLRETCGPFLCMVDDQQIRENVNLYRDWLTVGFYSDGSGLTSIAMKQGCEK